MNNHLLRMLARMVVWLLGYTLCHESYQPWFPLHRRPDISNDGWKAEWPNPSGHISMARSQPSLSLSQAWALEAPRVICQGAFLPDGKWLLAAGFTSGRL